MKSFALKLVIISLMISCSSEERNNTYPNLDCSRGLYIYDKVYVSRSFGDEHVKLFFVKNCDTLKIAEIRKDIYSYYNDSLVVSVVKKQIEFDNF